MREGLGERLRSANPIPASELVAADERLLSRIIASPRDLRKRPWTCLSRRRAVTLIAAAVIVIGGLAAAASKFAPQYFGPDDREPTPAAVLAALRGFANLPGGPGEIDASGLVRLAAFDTEGGRATIYAAPMRSGSGFCSVDALGEELGGGGCDDWNRDEPVPYIGSGSSAWGDVRVLQGRLVAQTARIQVRFEDGAVRAASIRAPWWVYVVGGDETEPGHRPVGLTALDVSGAAVATEAIKPYYYTREEAVDALLPESDGSPGQDAILATLKALGDGPWLEHQRVRIDRTALLRRIETDQGRLDIYTAPWGAGGVCIGYASSTPAFEPGVTACPANEPSPEQREGFDRDETNVIRLAPFSAFIIIGPPPRGTARIEIRFEDGASAEPDILAASSFIAWLGPERLVPGHRPTELTAAGVTGRKIASLRLDAKQFTSG
jgi:hypothetical protein